MATNCAPTLLFAVIEIAQTPVPVQPAPVQPAKRYPLAGAAVKTTLVPGAKVLEQAVGQLMPLGAEVTVPEPVTTAFSAKVPTGTAANDALTVLAAVTVTSQTPVPLQPAPLHPEKANPVEGVAANRTMLPCVKLAPHVAPQLMPAGDEATLPEPLSVTLNGNVVAAATGVNVAVTERSAVMLIWQGAVPAQLMPLPFHPVKV